MILRLAAFLLLAVTVPSRAFVAEFNGAGLPLKWNFGYIGSALQPVSTNVFDVKNHAIRYFLASDAWSPNNATAELNAIRASIAQWMVIPGTSIKFEEGGLIYPSTNALDINLGTNNLGTNYIFWKKGDPGNPTSTLVDGGHVDLGTLLGLTFVSWYPASNSISIAQTVYNGVVYGWFTDYSDTTNANYFVEGTAIHELGHFLGLKHTTAGTATMIWQGTSGFDIQNGLSDDEIAAARFLYPAPNTTGNFGTITGTISFNTTNLASIAAQVGITLTNASDITNYFTTTNMVGAVVTAEDLHGNVAGSTVSATNGFYILPSLPPGTYNVRVTPLDSTKNPSPLILGINIDSPFAKAFTSFLPTTNYVVTVAAGMTHKMNFLLGVGFQPFTLNYFRDPTDPLVFGSYGIHSQGVQIYQGQTNFTAGVGSFSFPGTNLTLSVSGDGVEYGATTIDTNSFASYGLTMLTIPLTVHLDAVPGLRTFFVNNGTNTFVANGYLRIRPDVPDFNYDGFDDRFQRRYFPLFTAPEAGPLADPDGDGYNNYAEYISGTDPTNPASYLKIAFATETSNGTLLGWEGQPNKLYQVFSKDKANQPNWTPVGGPYLASLDASMNAAAGAGVDPSSVSASSVLFIDLNATNNIKFYRIQALPPPRMP